VMAIGKTRLMHCLFLTVYVSDVRSWWVGGMPHVPNRKDRKFVYCERRDLFVCIQGILWRKKSHRGRQSFHAASFASALAPDILTGRTISALSRASCSSTPLPMCDAKEAIAIAEGQDQSKEMPLVEDRRWTFVNPPSTKLARNTRNRLCFFVLEYFRLFEEILTRLNWAPPLNLPVCIFNANAARRPQTILVTT
jgi:hypothetical protein